MRAVDEFKYTANSTLYSKLRKQYLGDRRVVYRWPLYHKYDNAGRRPYRSWKSRRRTQWK